MNYDILKSSDKIWDIYTVKNDYQINETNNNLKRNSEIIKNPLASEYLFKNEKVPEYPNGEGFALCLTHDVDEIYFPWSHLLQAIIYYAKKMNTHGIINSFHWKFRKKESPYLDFKKILDLEKTYNVRSTFFFLATEKDPIRFRYVIEDATEIIKDIQSEGFEIGLHGGYYAYNNLEDIIQQKIRLERVSNSQVIGYRNHYLNFNVPQTWYYLTKAGFTYDSTIGYNTNNGFRNGMCHPYKPYDRNINNYINIIEIPPIIMDSAFPKGTLVTNWWELKKMLKVVEKNHGVLTVNFHNEVFHAPYKADFMKLYVHLLEEGRRRKAWMTNASEIHDWWRKKYIEEDIIT